MSATAAALIGGAYGVMSAGVGYAANQGLTARARKENYMYNEMAAQNADERTRNLYMDLYSPAAQLKQLQDAGLSPSLFYQDGGGVSGQAGAQGGGPAGPQQSPFYMNPLEFAQAANLMADAKLKEAETHNVQNDTIRIAIENDIRTMAQHQYKIEFNIATAVTKDGRSLYEYANDFYNVDDFIKAVRKDYEGRNNAEAHEITSEYGTRLLRDIYMTRNEFGRNIAVLSNDKVSSEFQSQIVKAMQNTDFASMNAKAAVQYLKANVATEELTEQQKNAWNHLLGSIENKFGEDAKDVVVILAQLLNNTMTNWHMPNSTQQTFNNNTNNTTNVHSNNAIWNQK